MLSARWLVESPVMASQLTPSLVAPTMSDQVELLEEELIRSLGRPVFGDLDNRNDHLVG